MLVPISTNFAQSWLPDVFNDIFDNNRFVKADAMAPSVNIAEDDKNFTIEIAAPGMTKEDFKIHVDDNGDLVINMEKQTNKEEKENNNCRYLRREFSYSKFTQALTLPDNVEKENISASVKDGILSITLPKRVEEAKVVRRAIEVM